MSDCIKGVLFDLDQTLLNRDESLIRFLSWQYSALSLSAEGISEHAYQKEFINEDKNGSVWKDKVYSKLISVFNIEGYSQDFLLRQYIERFRDHCVEVNGASKLINKLRHAALPMGIVTNGKSPFQEKNIESLGWNNDFKVILVSENVGLRKPSTEIFLLACQGLGVSPSQTLFVGDNPKSDIMGAKDAGLQTFFLKTKYHNHCDGADFTGTDLNLVSQVIFGFDSTTN
ncbi:MAG: HAD family hydrolase [Pseudobacteriovorax sp.]|nr:HAD family hydrolase [Pseudobacteriovorax sp.]